MQRALRLIFLFGCKGACFIISPSEAAHDGAERHYCVRYERFLSVIETACAPLSEHFNSESIVTNVPNVIFLFKYKLIQSTFRVSWRVFAPKDSYNVALDHVVFCSVWSGLMHHECSSFSSQVSDASGLQPPARPWILCLTTLIL
jgi:hypothetical protein